MYNYNELKSFYQGKKVFLTGHTGFKGAWLLALLNQFNAKVTGYALAPKTKQDLFSIIQGEKLCNSVLADIRNAQLVEQQITDFQPDIVIHFAAQPLVIDSYSDPLYTYETNVMGTANVLNAVRKLPNKCTALIITTDKVYENKEHVYPYRESDTLGGFDPYSNSKACAELVTQSFRDSFMHENDFAVHQKTIISARSGNVIGGGDYSENRIIPDLVRSLEAQKPLTMRNPSSVRPWQHVLDPLNGYLQYVARVHSGGPKISSALNFGPYPHDELTVQQLVEKAIQVWGSGNYETPNIQNKVHEAGLLKLDISLAKAKLNWQPILTSAETIEYTIEWYKQAAEKRVDFTYQQIEAYYNKVNACK